MSGGGATRPAAPTPLVRVTAGPGPWMLGLADLVRHRDLVLVLAAREVKLRYRYTALGVIWVLLQPLLAMAVFTAVFSRVVALPMGACPYPLFLLAGLVPWQFFSNGLAQASQSLVAHRALVTKVYFPRMVVPTATVLAGLVDMVVALGLLALVLVALGVRPTGWLACLPLVVAGAVLTTAGVAWWLSALTARFRDLRHVLPYLTQLWLFATPVVYNVALVPERWRPIFALNPLAWVVDGFRLTLLGLEVDRGSMLVSLGVAALLFVSGGIYFQRTERTLADVL